jgi:hypothetical protein
LCLLYFYFDYIIPYKRFLLECFLEKNKIFYK